MIMPDSAYRNELSPAHSGSYYMTGSMAWPPAMNSIAEAPNNFTIEFWAKPTATHEIDEEGELFGGTSGQRYLIAPSWYADPSEAGMGVSMGTNGVSVYEHADNYMPALLVWQSPTPITDWVHVAIVYEDNLPYLYINGVLVHTGQQSSRQLVYPSFNFTGYGYGSFQGYLDEMRIWGESRSQQQIADNRYGPITSPQTNLSGYWPVDAANPGVLLDLSGNGRDVSMNSTTGNSSDHTMGGNGYRFSINGQEKENDVNENITTALYWEYDSRIGRRWNVDPIFKDWESPYACFSDNPVNMTDPFGLDPDKPKYKVLKGVRVKSTISKKTKAKIELYAKKEGISFKQARQELDKNGNEINVKFNSEAEARNHKNVIQFHDAGTLMERDMRRISTEITIDVLKVNTMSMGALPIVLTGAEIWAPMMGLATEKSIEYYVIVNMSLNSARRKLLLSILDLAVVKYGKDALYRKELWALSTEIKEYKNLLTPKIMVEILNKLDKIIKSVHPF